MTTKFIDDHKSVLLAAPDVNPVMQTLAAHAYCVNRSNGAFGHPIRVNSSAQWTVPFAREHSSTSTATGSPPSAALIRVSWIENDTYRVALPDGGASISVTPCPPLEAGRLAAHVDGQRVEYEAVVSPDSVAILHSSGTHLFKLLPLAKTFGKRTAAANGSAEVLCPMPGKVVKFLVAQGAMVTEGQGVVIVEAMKMEHIVKAQKAGVISLNAKEGSQAAADQTLAVIA